MVGSNRRLQRIEKEVRQLIAVYLTVELKKPLTGFASVTRVQVSPDLRHGKVFVSIIGEVEDREGNWEILKDQLPEIQRYLGSQLKIKYTPKIQLILDTSADHVEKIDRILANIHKNSVSSLRGEDGN